MVLKEENRAGHYHVQGWNVPTGCFDSEKDLFLERMAGALGVRGLNSVLPGH